MTSAHTPGPHADWHDHLSAADNNMALAKTYADDGAYAEAARKAARAAKHFREAARLRAEAMSLAVEERS